MQIQFIVSAVSYINDAWVVHEPGTVVDMTDTDAAILIADGSAVAVEAVKSDDAPKKKRVV